MQLTKSGQGLLTGTTPFGLNICLCWRNRDIFPERVHSFLLLLVVFVVGGWLPCVGVVRKDYEMSTVRSAPSLALLDHVPRPDLPRALDNKNLPTDEVSYATKHEKHGGGRWLIVGVLCESCHRSASHCAG